MSILRCIIRKLINASLDQTAILHVLVHNEVENPSTMQVTHDLNTQEHWVEALACKLVPRNASNEKKVKDNYCSILEGAE